MAVSNVSCAFANAVAKKAVAAGGDLAPYTVTAASPTGKSYTLTCFFDGGGAITCRGGNGAVVGIGLNTGA